MRMTFLPLGISLITFVEVLYWLACFFKEAVVSAFLPRRAGSRTGSDASLGSQGTHLTQVANRFQRKSSADFLAEAAEVDRSRRY